MCCMYSDSEMKVGEVCESVSDSRRSGIDEVRNLARRPKRDL